MANTNTNKITVAKRKAIVSSLGLTEEDIKDITVYVATTRHTQGLESLAYWSKVGKIAGQVKASKESWGKIHEVVNAVLKTTLSDVEISSSQRVHNLIDAITVWYKKTKCTKSNPRTIMDAYNYDLPEAVKKRKDAEKVREAEKKAAEEKAAEKLAAIEAGEEVPLDVDEMEIIEPKADFSVISEMVIQAKNLYDIASEAGDIDDKAKETLARLLGEFSHMIENEK